jgi:hypothetical protein
MKKISFDSMSSDKKTKLASGYYMLYFPQKNIKKSRIITPFSRERKFIEELQKPTPLGVGCGTAIETCNSQSPLLLVVGIYPTLFI